MMSKQGQLYVVATPIGNLGDITARAIDILNQVGVIAAEDTRHSARLLQHLAISTPTLAYHEHNERQLCGKLIERIQAGEDVALISDAGTPLVSDPGYHLVRAAHIAGVQVVPVPGASAMVAALSCSGLPSDRFVFEGFLPAKSSGRRQRLEALSGDARTHIFYESTHRIEASLTDMLEVFGPQRQAVIARELTKRFETIHGNTLEGLLAWLVNDADQRRGEFVVLVQGADIKEDVAVDADAQRVLGILMQELPLKQAAALAAKISGSKKNKLYRLGLAMADKSEGND